MLVPIRSDPDQQSSFCLKPFPWLSGTFWNLPPFQSHTLSAHGPQPGGRAVVSARLSYQLFHFSSCSEPQLSSLSPSQKTISLSFLSYCDNPIPTSSPPAPSLFLGTGQLCCRRARNAGRSSRQSSDGVTENFLPGEEGQWRYGSVPF